MTAPHWTDFGLRHREPVSGYTRVDAPPPFLQGMIDGLAAELTRPLGGVTADGTARTGLFPLDAPGAATGPLTDSAQALVASLSGAQRERLLFPLDADEKRMWFNIHPNVLRHGLLLADLTADQRRAVLAVMEATLSARGFRQARDVMALNGLLVEITGSADEFGEWPYWFSLFGTPSPDEPWAWQIDGHHLNLNCLVLGDHLVLTPSFMGSEPCSVDDGPLAGTAVFGAEQRAGLELIRSLDDAQLATAVLQPSIVPDDLPPELRHPIDGRMVGGAFKDNAVVPTVGVPADDLTDAQRGLLRNLVATYVGWGGDAHAAIRMDDVDAHLDETHFAWMGTHHDDEPFYYRVQSPVVLIEFDHHPGIVFDNLTPSRHHIHTVMRTPNGGDYGVDLLRQHHERFDHSDGHHAAH